MRSLYELLRLVFFSAFSRLLGWKRGECFSISGQQREKIIEKVLNGCIKREFIIIFAILSMRSSRCSSLFSNKILTEEGEMSVFRLNTDILSKILKNLSSLPQRESHAFFEVAVLSILSFLYPFLYLYLFLSFYLCCCCHNPEVNDIENSEQREFTWMVHWIVWQSHPRDQIAAFYSMHWPNGLIANCIRQWTSKLQVIDIQ